MSRGIRWAIGTVMILGATGFILVMALGPQHLNAGLRERLAFAALPLFCLVSALGCFVPAAGWIVWRIVGATIAGVYAWYASDAIAQDHLGRAIVGFIIFGLPGMYVAVTGRYPDWGSHSYVFGGAGEPGEEDEFSDHELQELNDLQR